MLITERLPQKRWGLIEMTLKVKCLMYKPEDLSLIPRTHRKMGENQLHRVVLWLSGVHRGTCPPYHHTHNNNKGKKENWGGWLVRNIKDQHLASTCAHANLQCVHTQWRNVFYKSRRLSLPQGRIDVDRLFLGLMSCSRAVCEACCWGVKAFCDFTIGASLKLQFFWIEIQRKTPVKVLSL